MVNILVPTDFSQLSKSALKYAIKIANKLGGNVTVLHVMTMTRALRISVSEKILSPAHDMIGAAEEELEVMIRTLSEQYKAITPIKYHVVRGAYFPSTLLREARRLHSGLVVMGTRGATGITKTFLGSNTNSVIEVSHVPVLAVPEKADFKGFRNVVYASDLRNLEDELTMLIRYIEKFESTIHLLHIVPPGEQVEEVESRIEAVLESFPYKNIITLVLVDHDINAAVDQYVEVSKADVLAMFTHEISFFEKVFDRSMTRKMAFHSRVPLLAFRQTRTERGL
ncbi:MAG TPA: universal stress protein [Chryseosolibacter sp.]|nr:universal stress protein [Chryseosolibacter sp.]